MTEGSGLPMDPLMPRTALVTGGAKRLGRALALGLADVGFDVAVHYARSSAEADEVVDAVRAKGRRAIAIGADLSSESETRQLWAQAQQAIGPIGCLINNASVFERDEWDTTSRASWDAHLIPNLWAPFLLSQAMAEHLPSAARGVIINMLDQRVWSLTPHFVSYTVSKSALWSLTQQLALALAPRVRVNAIGPGPALPSSRQSAEQFARQASSTPLEHGTSPDEVARAALAILALPSMTGQMIALDGGQHLQWGPVGKLEAMPE